MAKTSASIIGTLLFVVFAALSVGVAGHALLYLSAAYNPANPFHVQFAVAGWAVPAHFHAAGLALALAPLQMSSRLRRRWPSVHRATGWLYVIAVVIGALSAMLLAPNAQAGMGSSLAFSSLSLVWLMFTGLALRAALRRDTDAHRRWMLRSVALTFAAVSLRVYLGVGAALLSLPFNPVYVASAWLSWTVNLLLMEVYLRGWMQLRRRPAQSVDAGTRWASARTDA